MTLSNCCRSLSTSACARCLDRNQERGEQDGHRPMSNPLHCCTSGAVIDRRNSHCAGDGIRSVDTHTRELAFTHLVDVVAARRDFQRAVLHALTIDPDGALINHPERLGGAAHQARAL